MGRVLRIRKRKKNRGKQNSVLLNSEIEYLELIEWMKECGWKPTCKLVSAYFKETGRGLMAKQRIFAGAAIAKIPYKLLITVNTVIESQICWLFKNRELFSTQQVLSSFLVWECHLSELSRWKKYINCLPREFSCPAYCSDINWLPQDLADKVQDIKAKVLKTYNSIVNCVNSKRCSHCDVPLSSIFTYDIYLWAWCVVSTRAVYLCPKFNRQDVILLSDENNLALAPYIDLFNHNYEAEVKAYVVESEGMYQIETMKPFPKNHEIFINYGPLSNDRLFIDYGFIIPSNIQDAVAFTCEEVLKAANELIPSNTRINACRCSFLQEKQMFSNISCHSSGLSWDCQALIYVFICPPEIRIEEIKQNIFSSMFKKHSEEDIRRVAEIVIKSKRTAYEEELATLKNYNSAVEMYRECFNVACELLNERMNLLDKCRLCLAMKNND